MHGVRSEQTDPRNANKAQGTCEPDEHARSRDYGGGGEHDADLKSR